MMKFLHCLMTRARINKITNNRGVIMSTLPVSSAAMHTSVAYSTVDKEPMVASPDKKVPVSMLEKMLGMESTLSQRHCCGKREWKQAAPQNSQQTSKFAVKLQNGMKIN